ncbi:aminopeptidase [Garciella nitratireducens]|uniref:M18 family aminopeptidase n=1 Tax=Garciella nitratireducens DSM 15102 TaxID=1121911 RepID=A0A1T4LBL7_9FIRM|nr:aminopeptidase [Garciella nitratireducens]RBP46734.1 aspartyl aminopeptidase [Garciella nitratireducens]SJZ52056.1 Aspartyl aminopeptidase [Garciella nitratireducens DSM 15102]
MKEENGLQKKLVKKWGNGWKIISEEQKKQIFEFSEGYKNFLDLAKTERESVKEIVKLAEKNGFISLEEVIKQSIKLEPGQKLYKVYNGKTIALFVLGKEDLTKGMNIVGSHIDSPRLDLKPNPLYEEEGMAFFKTHYYGGIKKYQWVTIPLSLHGVVITRDGKKVEIKIGEGKGDPVFYISDLLPHLAKDQMEKKMAEGVSGEGLNLVVGSIPYGEEDLSEAIKLNILNLLYEKYGMVEEDFVSADLEAVPAYNAKDVGLDRSFITAYGQDDRVCAYTSLQAILGIKDPQRTAVALMSDKEEVGSQGSTGMQSAFFENMVAELIELTQEQPSELKVRRALSNSKVLSADVNAGYDPNFPDTHDKNNAAYIGKGVVLTKYTGARGKSGSNDANAEFMGEVRKVFHENDVIWQTGELGKVDKGGGGTIAYILANYGMDVVDCGTALLSMHAPMELSSKLDVYETYKAFRAFYKIK